MSICISIYIPFLYLDLLVLTRSNLLWLVLTRFGEHLFWRLACRFCRFFLPRCVAPSCMLHFATPSAVHFRFNSPGYVTRRSTPSFRKPKPNRSNDQATSRSLSPSSSSPFCSYLWSAPSVQWCWKLRSKSTKSLNMLSDSIGRDGGRKCWAVNEFSVLFSKGLLFKFITILHIEVDWPWC